MAIQYAVFESYTGKQIADYSARAIGLAFATNNRGDAECTAFVPMGLNEAFRLYDRPGLPHVQVTDSAAGVVFLGRVEDITLNSTGVTITAMGYSRSLTDIPYTALWSTTAVTPFRPVLASEFTTGTSTATPDRYRFDTNNRVYITPQKGAIHGSTTLFKAGMMCYQLPDDSSRSIIGASFDYVQLAPAATWRFMLQTRDDAFAGIANVWSVTGGIGVSPGSVFVTFAAARIVNFYMDFNAADAVFAGETGSAYLIVTNIRLVTTTTNKVDTLTTAIHAAGANTTITVGSTARMYVGQRMHIGIPAALGETVVVESITSATQFVADTTAGAAIGVNVQAHVVYADEIVKDIVSTVSTLNSTQISSSTILVQSPALDLFDEVYEDQRPSDILDRLIVLGDNQTTPRLWEWGVRAYQRLYYRPQLSGRVWYVDVSAVEIQRTLEELSNSVYAVYRDANNRALRAAVTADSASVSRYGLTRRTALGVTTTSTTQAAMQQAAALNDGKDPKPRAGIVVTFVYDATGSAYPLWSVTAGDTVIIRNLSPTLSSTLDRIRSFRVSRASYDADTDTLAIEPESPLPSLQNMLSRAVAPTFVTAPWWIQIQQ